MKEKNEDKKEEKGFSSFLWRIMDPIKDHLIAVAKETIREKFENAINAIEDRLLRLQSRLFFELASMVVGLAAIVFVVLALVFYLSESFDLSTAEIFTALALAFFILSFFLRYNNRR